MVALAIDMSAELLPVTFTVAMLLAGTGSVSGMATTAWLVTVPIAVTVAVTVITGMLVKLAENGPGRVQVSVGAA